MRKRVVSRGMSGLAVALGVTALVIFFLLLYGGGEGGLAQRLPQVEMSLSAQAGEGVVGYSLLLSNQEEGEIALDRIEVLLPEGLSYVGLAASSEVSVEPSQEEKALLWSGPFILPGEGSLALDFWAVAPKGEVSGPSRATAYVGDTVVASAEEELTVAPWPPPSEVTPPSVSPRVPSSVGVTKLVTPATSYPTQSVLYTVVFDNTGGVDPVDLNSITDTFNPAVVRHGGPAYGSEITDCPAQADWGKSSVTCTGPYTVLAGSTLTWKYYGHVLETSEEQTITNTLQAEATDGTVGPVEETLDIELLKVFVPMAMKEVRLAGPASLEDHFDAHADNWTPFTNYWRLNEEQWYWDAAAGYEGGGYRHNKNLGGDEAHDALTMYLQAGSEEWTDYRFQARVNLVDGRKIGLWFRLTYVEEESGKKLTGYYFDMTGSKLELYQIQTEDECVPDECDWIYHFAAPILLTEVSYSSQEGVWYNLKVEVDGSLIKCYVDDVLMIEYNDTVGTTFLQGTVGLFVYKADDARFDDVLVEPL